MTEDKNRKVYSEKEMKVEELKDNVVIINIWTSQVNPKYPGHGVGHVSIKTKNQYMSLWPYQGDHFHPAAKDSEGKGVVGGISHELLANYNMDYDYERRHPETRFCFYTLDTESMEKKFSEFKESIKGWAIIPCGDVKSCASMACELLAAGSIGKLKSISSGLSSVGSDGSSKGASKSTGATSSMAFWSIVGQKQKAQVASQNSSQASLYSTEMSGAIFGIVSPDALEKYLEKAKKEEEKKRELVGKKSEFPLKDIILTEEELLEKLEYEEGYLKVEEDGKIIERFL